MRFFKQMNESIEGKYIKDKKKLDETLPKDLMKKIQRTKDYQGYGGRNGDQGTSIQNIYDYDIEARRDITGVKDYQNASAEELTVADVLAMKKAGEDLSNIYVIDDSGDMISLDREGHPRYSGSTYKPRANQSLKKTLETATKIYRADIKDLMDTDPEKARARFADSDVRKANMGLGHNRPRSYEKGRRDSYYVERQKELNKLKPKIDAIKAEYEEGDISRKEMERRIAEIKRRVGSMDWAADAYQRVRNKNAENRYKASEKTLKEPFDRLESARQDLYWSKNDLARSQKQLDSVKAGDTSNASWGDNYLYAKKKVAEITAQIAKLQKDLDRYQSQLDNGAYDKQVKELEDKIASEQARIQKAQGEIDALLRRN